MVNVFMDEKEKPSAKRIRRWGAMIL